MACPRPPHVLDTCINDDVQAVSSYRVEPLNYQTAWLI